MKAKLSCVPPPCAISMARHTLAQGDMMFHPGEIWRDTAGQPIQAHGGGMLMHNGVYYWYGENKAGPTMPGQRVDVIGVSCYSSRNLYDWTNEGVVLPAVPTDPTSDLHPSMVVERPKVLYNASTRQFVMWMHIDSADYQRARAGVAVSDAPTGPFRYQSSVRPDGMESRDLTLFQDDDGTAYLVFGAQWHSMVCVARLTDDYRATTGHVTSHFHSAGPPAGREAPALFRHGPHYFMVTSGTTGWESNAAEYAVAAHPDGPWTVCGNPCVGPDAALTFRAQSTYVFPIAGRPGLFVLMLDRWNPADLRDSRYVWLPIEIEETRLTIRWHDAWDWHAPDAAVPLEAQS